ncbi:MAG TPA: hypothetical protein ENN80_00185, partial [Candidatus Hydrogenedentes bacterium]|nr:hypothetical protein [Candidatus Hydrogenedentota bacterium]
MAGKTSTRPNNNRADRNKGRPRNRNPKRHGGPPNRPQNKPNRNPQRDLGLPSDDSLQDVGEGPELSMDDLKKMTMPELSEAARTLGIEGYSGLKKQDLIFRVLQA